MAFDDRPEPKIPAWAWILFFAGWILPCLALGAGR